MGPADREVRLECNQFFPEQCINMMAWQLGKGEGPVTVPKPSELSAEGHNGETGPVEAKETPWRRCGCSWGCKGKASQAGGTTEAKVRSLDMSLYASSCPHLIPTSHCIIHSIKPSMAPSYLPHVRVPVLTRPPINCVILGMSPPLLASVSSSIK